jgi:hypothetical protein
LSSTLRYQRDSVLDFLHYVGRFVCFVWLELPLYFWAKGRKVMAAKCLAWELASYAFVGGMAYWRFRPALFALIIPLVQVRPLHCAVGFLTDARVLDAHRTHGRKLGPARCTSSTSPHGRPNRLTLHS